MSIKKPAGISTGFNLISCTSELSLQDHDDLTHCTQIATLSADRVSSRFVDSTQWLNEYVLTMNFFGWSVYQDAIFTRTRHNVPTNVAEFLLNQSQSIAQAAQRNALSDTFDALKYNSSALLSMDEESHLGERFQVIPARYDARGILEISVLNLELISSKKNKHFLFFSSGQKTASVIQQRASLKLDRRILEAKRSLINEKRREIRMQRFNLMKG